MTDRFLGEPCPVELQDAGERLSVDKLRTRQLAGLQTTVRAANENVPSGAVEAPKLSVWLLMPPCS